MALLEQRTRIACIQLAVHPAISIERTRPMEDPLYEPELRDSLHIEGAPTALADRIEVLRETIGETYRSQLSLKLRTVLQYCRNLGVRIAVFPEYAVPWQLLPLVVEESGEMVIVAGTHVVDREARQRDIYRELGVQERPSLAHAICPIVYGGRIVAVQPKLNLTMPEQLIHLKAGASFNPVPLPDDIPGPMGVLICRDFLDRESEAHQSLVAERLAPCRFLAVPSYTPTHSLPEFSAKGWESARRYGKPVLYADVARLDHGREGGGTTVYVDRGPPTDLRDFPSQPGWLEANEEGIIVSDIDLTLTSAGPSTQYGAIPGVEAVAAASLLYPADTHDAEYARWLGEHAHLLANDDESSLEALSSVVDNSSELLQTLSRPATTRGRRLGYLLREHNRFADMTSFRRCLREVVLPPDVLPLPSLRSAMARGTSDALKAWQPEFPLVSLSEVLIRLELTAKDCDPPDPQRFSPAGTAALLAASQRVRGEARNPQEFRVDLFRNAVIVALEADESRGTTLFDKEDYLSALAEYRMALATTQPLADVAPEDDNLKKAIALQRLRIASCHAQLNDLNSLLSDLKQIEHRYLSPKDAGAFLTLLTSAGQRETSRALLESGVVVEAPERLRELMALIDGDAPPTPPLEPSLRLLAAQILLYRHGRAATAVTWAQSAHDDKPGRLLNRLRFLEVLVDALHATIFEDASVVEPVAVSDRAGVLAQIEEGVHRALHHDNIGWPTAIRKVAVSVAAKFFLLIDDSERNNALESVKKELQIELGLVDQQIADMVTAGRMDEALDTLPLGTHPWVRDFQRSQLMAQAKRFDAAIELTRTLATKFPGRVPIELLLVRLLLTTAQTSEALAHAEIAYELFPSRPVRIALGLACVAAGSLPRAWDLLGSVTDTRQPHVLHARATVAERVAPDRAIGAWQLYLERCPEDIRIHVRVASLRALVSASEAAAAAWATFERFKDANLTPEDAYLVAQLQQLDGDAAQDGRDRVLAVAETLQKRFPGDANAEAMRLLLLGRLGPLEDSATIDYSLLIGAGIVKEVEISELVRRFTEERQANQAAHELYRNGFLSLEQLVTNLDISTAELIVSTLETEVPLFTSPLRIGEIPVASLSNLELLMSDAELLLLLHLDLLDSLRQALGPRGVILLFDDVLDRITNASFELTSRRQPVAQERVDALSVRLDELSVAGRVVRLASDEEELALKDSATFIGNALPADVTSAVSPRHLAERLFNKGLIDQYTFSRLSNIFSPPDPRLPDWTFQRDWIIDRATLQAFFDVGVLTAVVEAAPQRLLIGRQTTEMIVNERRRYRYTDQVSRRATKLARVVHSGRGEGWIRTIGRPEITYKLPPLRVGLKGPRWESLARSGVARALAFKDALVDHSRRRLFSIDFFTASLFEGSMPVEVLGALQWTPDVYRSLVIRYRPVTNQCISCSNILSLLLSGPQDHTSRTALVQMGIRDALNGATIVYLENAYQGIQNIVPKKILDIFEAPGRISEHPGRAAARWCVSNVYARAAWEAYHPAAAIESAGVSHAWSLTTTLLSRAEQLDLDLLQGESVLEQMVGMIMAMAVSRPASAMISQADDILVVSNDSAFGQLAKVFVSWAAEHATRRSALARAYRQTIVHLDEVAQSSGSSATWAPLLLIWRLARTGQETPQQTPENETSVQLLTPEDEALSMASALQGDSRRGGLLEHDGISFRRGDAPEFIMFFEHILRSAAAAFFDSEATVTGNEGYVRVPFKIELLEDYGNVLVAPEAIALRIADTGSISAAQSFARGLARVIGPHDSLSYQAMISFVEAPTDSARRHAVMRCALSAQWRSIRENPLLLLRWGHSAFDEPKTIRKLCAMLAEDLPLPDSDLLDVLFARLEGGTWSGRLDGFELAVQASEVPGGLSGMVVASLLAQEGASTEISAALTRLGTPHDQPAARLARDIILLRTAAASQPQVQLRDEGSPVDLNERLPALFSRVLAAVASVPPSDSLAAFEGDVLRLCRRVVVALARTSPLSFRDGIWLTFRLYQWYLAQLQRRRPVGQRLASDRPVEGPVDPEIWQVLRSNFIAAEPADPSTWDLLDPRHFDRDLFDHRLAAVLHALDLAEVAAARLGRRAPETQSSEPASVASPALVATLLEIAQRPVSRRDDLWRHRGATPSTLPWYAPAVVQDLALQALLHLDSAAITRCDEDVRLRWWSSLPTGESRAGALTNSLAISLMAAAASHLENFVAAERTLLRERARSLSRSPDFVEPAFLLLARLCIYGETGVVEEVARLLEPLLNSVQAPLLFGEYLMALSRARPADIRAEAVRILELACQRGLDAVALASGLGRLAFLGAMDSKEVARDMLIDLDKREPYRGDSRFEQLLQLVG